MKLKSIAAGLSAIAVVSLSTTTAEARKGKAAPTAPLTEIGEKLQAEYTKAHQSLKEEILSQLPDVSPQRKKAYADARKAEEAAKAALEAVQKRQATIKKGIALVGHAKGKWIGGAEKGIAKTNASLQEAKTPAEKEAAAKELAKWQENLKAGLDALKERQAFLDKALKDNPTIEQDMAKAKSDLEKAKANTLAATNNLGLKSTLTSDKLDAKLAQYVVMLDATPRGLAAYAQQGKAEQARISELLANDKLLIQIAVADGASNGKFGKAMEIYEAIQKTSSKAGKGILQRLALAVALEHAKPIGQRNAVADTDAPEFVDPVQRYLHFEKAYLNNELDPGFADLSVWNLRMVVDGEEPNAILSWGRQMLSNYRPDHITTDDYRWRYVALVRSDIRYGSQDNKYDQDELHFFQNILKNGGVCGRRAFIGRFILRAFGVPTTARPQRGHAALAHWTPEGWVVCLGAGWGAGWTKTPYKDDLDFLATTQARATGETYKQVKRAHWIGDVTGEKRAYGFLSTKTEPEFWNGVALYTQKGVIEAAKIKTLAAVGEDIGEANETKEKVDIIKAEITADDRKVSVDSKGVITIPAAATDQPTKSNGKIIFMPSNLGGLQMHYSRTGGDQQFVYTVDAPSAGKYALTSRLCTPSWQQHLLLKINGASEPVDIVLPHTVGLWGQTKPATVELKKGSNTLSFSHMSDGQAKGFSIRDFTLTPVR